MEGALRALLVGHAPLTAKVSADCVVWNHLPQSAARPAIVLFKITGSPGITLQGSDGLEGSIVQIDVQALKVSDMWAIKRIVIARLHGHRDETFQAILARGERQSSEDLPGVGLVHRASIDFDVWAAA